MKYIKIFLASSITELDTERLQLSDFIRTLNDSYVRCGIYFELIICEDVSNALRTEGKQQYLNNMISDSQFFYVLFGKSLGKYTLEEFHIALEQFRHAGAPKIYTYFRQLPGDTPPAQAIKDFMTRLDKELGHYYSFFTNIDSIKLNILLELTRDENVGGAVELVNGYATVNGYSVLSAENIPFYQRNEYLQSIVKARKELEESYEELVELLAYKPDNPMLKKMLEENSQKRNALLEQQHKLENEILIFYSGISHKRQLGQHMNWREQKAIELIDCGDYEGAKLILRDKQWDAELAQAEAITENMQDVIISYISGKRTLIQAISTTGINRKTEAEIIAIYEHITALAERHFVEMYVMYEYASFLMHHNMHTQAIKLSQRLDCFYSFKQITDGACADNKYLLACMLYKTNDLAGAEKQHREALAIRAGLEKSPAALAKYAASCNQLGYLLFRMGRLAEANELYQKAIEVLEQAVRAEPKYRQNLALVLNNSAILKQKEHSLELAADLFRQSLVIRRELAADEKTSSLGFLAMGCLNYAKVLTEANKPAEAMPYYSEAIGLYAQLCTRDTKFKIDHAIAQYYLATALEATDPAAALALHLEVLEQREALAETNREALKTDIAKSYFSIGRLMYPTDAQKAQTYLEDARLLWNELYEKAPARHREDYLRVKSFLDSIHADNT